MDFVGLFVFKGLNAISFRRFLLPRTSGPMIPAFGGNDKASSRDTSEPLFRDEWPSLFDHPHEFPGRGKLSPSFMIFAKDSDPLRAL
jgi:hypothetical protein